MIFAFNCCPYWSTLVIHGKDGMGHFLHINEGDTQGEPFVRIFYGLVITPLIQDIQAAYP